MKRKLAVMVVLILVGGLISACQTASNTGSGYYLVDPRFSDLYQRFDGDNTLGGPISSIKYLAGSSQEKQYFEGLVMVYDPDGSPHYYLEPVGREAGFSDLPDQDPGNNSIRFLNGFIIPGEFEGFYDQMGGERWVGLPLTRARLNPDRGRIEQYYENMGFFRFVDDPPGQIYLMPYGLWKCADECSQYPGLQNTGIGTSSAEKIPSPFGEAVARFGTAFTGQQVSSAYRGEDGAVEQIYQNVVLYQDQASPLGVSLRPVSVLLETARTDFEPRRENAEEYFYQVSGDKGYYIPAYFMDYINRYFGFELSGKPISRLESIREGVWQQCYENYCLLYDEGAAPGQQVRLLPQGQKYRESFQRSSSPAWEESNPAPVYQLDIWEQLPQISSLEVQQIGACIHEAGSAVPGAGAELILSPAGGRSRTYTFELTDTGGCTFLALDPIPAENGTTVDYQVCFFPPGGGEYCQKDSFLIWGNTETDPPAAGTEDEPAATLADDAPVVDVWELHPQLSSEDQQEIGACIHLAGEPLALLDPVLILDTPQAGRVTYNANPTDAGGCTFFVLDPVNATNGETIPYQVCLTDRTGSSHCGQDSFLIWGNP